MSVSSATLSAMLAQSCYAWQERALSVERRLADALAIVDNAARETMLDQHPYHAIALLNEDGQRRLHNLLKGD
jgi:hypothetical protein